MHIDSAFPSKFLKASDLNGKTAKVIISHYGFEKVGDDNKLVMYFRGKEKGLITNKTNATTIAAIYGPEMDDWVGGELELFEAMVDFQGKTSPAIRVRIPPRKPASQAPARQPAMADADERPTAPVNARAADFDDDIPFAPEWR